MCTPWRTRHGALPTAGDKMGSNKTIDEPPTPCMASQSPGSALTPGRPKGMQKRYSLLNAPSCINPSLHSLCYLYPMEQGEIMREIREEQGVGGSNKIQSLCLFFMSWLARRKSFFLKSCSSSAYLHQPKV